MIKAVISGSLFSVGSLSAAGVRHNQCHLSVHEHAQNLPALPTPAVRHLHPGHAAHVPLHGRDDRQDAHQGHRQGNAPGCRFDDG